MKAPPTGSLLSQSDKTNGAIGAFVPIDDGDFDYDGRLDDQEPGTTPPPVDDDRLLPVTLKGTGDANLGDYYTLENVPDFVRIFQQITMPSGVKTLTRVTPSTHLQSQNDQTIYVEGTDQGNDIVNVNWTNNGTTYVNVDYFWVTTFEMSGPMDVPGNGTYVYRVEDTLNNVELLPSTSKWVAPTGGALIANDLLNFEATIQWTNPADGEVGEAKFQVNSSYQWDYDVNVVGFSIVVGTNAVTYYKGSPVQENPGNSWIDSAVTGHKAVSVDLGVRVAGPKGPDGLMRGMKFMDLGYIQRGEVTFYDAQFVNGSSLTSALEGSGSMVDFQNILGAGPWYAPPITIHKDFRSALIIPDVSFSDLPEGWGITSDGLLTNDGSPLKTLNLLLNFQDWVAAATTQDTGGSKVVASKTIVQEQYAAFGEWNWSFDGSGTFFVATASPLTETYITFGGDTGDSTIGSPEDPINPTFVRSMNDIVADPSEDIWS